MFTYKLQAPVDDSLTPQSPKEERRCRKARLGPESVCLGLSSVMMLYVLTTPSLKEERRCRKARLEPESVCLGLSSFMMLTLALYT